MGSPIQEVGNTLILTPKPKYSQFAFPTKIDLLLSRLIHNPRKALNHNNNSEKQCDPNVTEKTNVHWQKTSELIRLFIHSFLISRPWKKP